MFEWMIWFMFWLLLSSPATIAKQAMIHQTWNASSSAHSSVIFYLFFAPSAFGSRCLGDNFNLRLDSLFGQVSASVTVGEVSRKGADCFVCCQMWIREKYDPEIFGDIHILHTHWINLIFKNIYRFMKEQIKASTFKCVIPCALSSFATL